MYFVKINQKTICSLLDILISIWIFENSNMLNFEIVDGTGPSKELAGQKCKSAYVPVKQSEYLFKGECDPTSNFYKMTNYNNKYR